MRKEELQTSPIVTLESLANQTEEQWEQNWQDLKFTIDFPRTVAGIVSSEQWGILTDENRKVMVEKATKTFMRLPWKLSKQGSVAGSALPLDKNLDLKRTNKREGAGLESTGENLMRCNIGSFILLGKSFNDKEWINNIVSESYQQFNSNKQNNFRQHILRLTTKDSFFRNWVKAHSLDNQNGFEWNRETARLFLQLCSKSDRSFPLEFEQDLTIYPLEVVDEFVSHALKYVNGPRTITKRASSKHTNPSVFITRIKELYESGYFDGSSLSLQVQGKIKDLKALIANKPA